jgi:hypothetical protein
MFNEVGHQICGVDFDNTIVSYDEVLGAIAKQRGLVDASEVGSKRKIRDRIRQLPDGEMEWQKCQALIYGPCINEARLIDGVFEFFHLCAQRCVKVYIVSHKTELSRFDTTGTNLRQAALDWMTRQRFFDANGLGLSESDVFFADSRREKTDTIAKLQCTHFIDDLVETFLEETFPQSTARILYDPSRDEPAPRGITVMRSWKDICEHLFAAR